MARVAVAMSGGVDSCTAAGLLCEAGHEVVGITLRLGERRAANGASAPGRCCSPADIRDARAVAAQLGVPHYVFDHAAEFREQIIEPFLSSWARARTPSPCVACNRKIKFGALWEIARGLGADLLATGHYARLAGDAHSPRLYKARDRDKDQSYFLFDVPRERLRDVLFPLGELTKAQVREAARRLGLGVADKPESYELCFIPDGDKDSFVERERGPQPSPRGVVRHTDGRALATHGGIHRFTIGQRRGLGLDGGERLYVIDLDAATGAVTVGAESDLYAGALVAAGCNWLDEAIAPPPRVTARIRHRHREAGAALEALEGGRVRVVFDRPQRAVAPGQGVAFYDGERLLGGGWIEQALRLSSAAPLPAPLPTPA